MVQYLSDYVSTPYTRVDRPLWWHEQGLQQTASGYGSKLTSRYCVQLADGRVRRIYVTRYGNAGSAWIMLDGKRFHLHDTD